MSAEERSQAAALLQEALQRLGPETGPAETRA